MAQHADQGDPSEAPVFIVGMPRSGTTLLEKMLLQHDRVVSIGESRALAAINLTLHQNHPNVPDKQLLFAWMQTVTADELMGCGRGYLQNARALVQGDGAQDHMPARIIDKMPLNCQLMPLARMILPNARFIFMRRHPMDVGLSNFTTLYQDGHTFANRLDWLGDKIKSVYGSLDHSRALLGDRLREQSYRALIDDPEGQMRQILRKGLDKWQAYDKELAPLCEALGGQDWLAAWEAETEAIVARQNAAHATA